MKYILLAVVSVLFTASCSKMDATYKEFIVDGETIYTGMVDSVVAHTGWNRIKLTWRLIPNPNITYCKVYWNNKADSAIIPVEDYKKPMSILIDNLSEGSHTFDLYTGDDEKHTSLKVAVTGSSLGDVYIASLVNRPVVQAVWTEGVNVVTWGAALWAPIRLGLELSYTDCEGTAQTIIVPDSDDVTQLEDYKEGTAFHYRTLFLPDSTAIDTFYTDFTEIMPVFE